MKNLITICILSLCMIGCEDSIKKRVQRKGEPDVLYVEGSDIEMNAAIEKAKETFPEFEKSFESKNPKFENFTIKQEFETSDSGGEHIWIGDLTFKGGRYFGVVQNVPIDVKKIKLGDSIQISLTNMSDWMYNDGNIVKGGYTIKVLRKHMSDEEKKEMDKEGLIYE